LQDKLGYRSGKQQQVAGYRTGIYQDSQAYNIAGVETANCRNSEIRWIQKFAGYLRLQGQDTTGQFRDTTGCRIH
jgi:hypothetical protein